MARMLSETMVLQEKRDRMKRCDKFLETCVGLFEQNGWRKVIVKNGEFRRRIEFWHVDEGETLPADMGDQARLTAENEALKAEIKMLKGAGAAKGAPEIPEAVDRGAPVPGVMPEAGSEGPKPAGGQLNDRGETIVG